MDVMELQLGQSLWSLDYTKPRRT